MLQSAGSSKQCLTLAQQSSCSAAAAPARTQAAQHLQQPTPSACREETTYKFAALAATGGVAAAAIVAVHYRFTWQLAYSGAQFSGLEAAMTLLLVFGGVVSPILPVTHSPASRTLKVHLLRLRLQV